MNRSDFLVFVCALTAACSSAGSSGGGADSGLGGTGAMSSGGTATGGGGGSPAGGAAGGVGATAGAGGIAGSAGSSGAGAGGQAQYNSCSNLEAECTQHSECCAGDPAGGGCVYTGWGTQCYPKCTSDEQCASGCCGVSGHCSWTMLANGEQLTVCDTLSCSLPGQGCDAKDCCAGLRCVDAANKGYGICAVVCTSDVDCPGGCCMATSGGNKVCSPKAFCPA